jgi:hypothetical protein
MVVELGEAYGNLRIRASISGSEFLHASFLDSHLLYLSNLPKLLLWFPIHRQSPARILKPLYVSGHLEEFSSLLGLKFS